MTPGARVSSQPIRTHSSNANRLLTADDLAARWSVSKAAVYRMTREGHIPAVRLGRYYRYRVAAVEEFETQGGVAADE